MLGGNFGVWGGLFSTFDCAVKGVRRKEDPWNAIIAGFFTGGSLAVRGGYKAARNGAIGCAVLLAVIEGVGIGFQRMLAGSTKLEVCLSIASCHLDWQNVATQDYHSRIVTDCKQHRSRSLHPATRRPSPRPFDKRIPDHFPRHSTVSHHARLRILDLSVNVLVIGGVFFNCKNRRFSDVGMRPIVQLEFGGLASTRRTGKHLRSQ